MYRYVYMVKHDNYMHYTAFTPTNHTPQHTHHPPGHFENTQVTVNNQVVVGTLMNLCDHPNRVSIGQGWQENDRCGRVPIIVTGMWSVGVENTNRCWRQCG